MISLCTSGSGGSPIGECVTCSEVMVNSLHGDGGVGDGVTLEVPHKALYSAMHLHTHTHTRTDARTHTHAHTHAHTRTHARTHAHTKNPTDKVNQRNGGPDYIPNSEPVIVIV